MIVTVFFRVNCPTQFQQTVYLVGNTQQLGNWNPSKGIKLLTNQEMYPVWWTDKGVEVDYNYWLEFKIVISDGVNFYWENISNRSLNICNQKQIIIATFNNPAFSICGLQRLFSEADLEMVGQSSKIRKIQVKIMNTFLECESDSDFDRYSELKSPTFGSKLSVRSLQSPTFSKFTSTGRFGEEEELMDSD